MHVERFADRDLVLVFILSAVLLGFRRTHHESASWDFVKLHANRVGDGFNGLLTVGGVLTPDGDQQHQ